MKRYNIHLNKEWVKDLDKITAEVEKAMGRDALWAQVTRADIIRAGLAIAYGFELEHIHHGPVVLLRAVKEVIKKRAHR